MKTDLIEIFQTIRAALQPYSTVGFNNRVSSETEYDLWSEKNVVVNGTTRPESFFLCLEIADDHVELDVLPADHAAHEAPFIITALDEVYLNQIEGRVAAGYKIFKEQEWV